MKWTLGFALFVLAACGTKTVAEMSFSEREALAEQIQERCLSQGTLPGTPRHEQCLRSEAQSEWATRERRARLEDNWKASRRGPTVCNTVGNTVICS